MPINLNTTIIYPYIPKYPKYNYKKHQYFNNYHKSSYSYRKYKYPYNYHNCYKSNYSYYKYKYPYNYHNCYKSDYSYKYPYCKYLNKNNKNNKPNTNFDKNNKPNTNFDKNNKPNTNFDKNNKPNTNFDKNIDLNKDNNVNNNILVGNKSSSDSKLNDNSKKKNLLNFLTQIMDKSSNKTNTPKIKSKKELNFEKNRDFDYKIINNIYGINDLIKIANDYNSKYKNKKLFYSLDPEIIYDLKEPLIKLNKLIGLNEIKNIIFEQIIFYLQNLENKNYDMLHTIIQGPPGTGKTELAKILAEVYSKIGILSKGTFLSVKRSDLIGEYLGKTAIKTKNVLDKAKGGVLFIDEAYSLGNKDGKDSYSKECIDTINSYLTDNKDDIIVIIAGYEKDLDKCFFSYNSGLERRFCWKFTLTNYSPLELKNIFKKKIYEYGWKIKNEEKNLPIIFFEKNYKTFKFNGGDMELLFYKCKIVHALRVIHLEYKYKKIIIYDDLINAFQKFIKNRNIENTEYYNYYT